MLSLLAYPVCALRGAKLINWLQDEVTEQGLKSVDFRPYQPRERLAESLSCADVHLVKLRPEMEGLIVPGKVYGILAVGRPRGHNGC